MWRQLIQFGIHLWARLKGLSLQLHFTFDGSVANKATVHSFVETRAVQLGCQKRKKDFHVIYFLFEETRTKPASYVNRNVVPIMLNLSHMSI